MEIKSARFISSYTDLSRLPQDDKKELAFIGRSNVGKSSLINMLCDEKKLAKTSGKPGKTQTINHFLINETWYLVDLPGFGYAKVSKDKRERWGSMIKNYLTKREALLNVFILIDSRLEAQKIDVEFINWMGENGIPFSIIFTKCDKLSKTLLHTNINKYQKKLRESWEELPPMFPSSAEKQLGKEELIAYFAEILQLEP